MLDGGDRDWKHEVISSIVEWHLCETSSLTQTFHQHTFEIKTEINAQHNKSHFKTCQKHIKEVLDYLHWTNIWFSVF